jgi:hypothetical protein
MGKIILDKIKYPSKDSLSEGRFSFIENDVLKNNIVIYVQYITFLLSLDEEYELGIITYSIYKDIVIHSALIIEGLLHNKLHEMINSRLIDPKDVLDSNFRYSEEKVIHECDDGKYVVCKVVSKGIEDDMQFIAINRAAKRSGLLTEGLFKKCEEVRTMRNKIHLSGLKSIDDQYSKKDINEVFDTTRQIINCIKNFNI